MKHSFQEGIHFCSFVGQLPVDQVITSSMFKTLLILSVVTVFAVEAQRIQKLKLRFKLSAKGLPDKDTIGTSDPYVVLYYTEGSSNKENKFGTSSTLTDDENPIWKDVFEFDFDRTKSQRWHFKIFDYDHFTEDEAAGNAWVLVEDYVDKGQMRTVNLHKQGTITIQSLEPVTQSPAVVVNPGGRVTPAVVPTKPPVVPPKVPAVVPPSNPKQTVQPRKLRFQLSATDLEDLDLVGTTDPYVKAFYTDYFTRIESEFGKTAPIMDTENPSWPETLEFDYMKGKKQRWHFEILDEDDHHFGHKDDVAGDAYINVDDFVSQGENVVLPLRKGQLILKRQ
ncbi:unnamed protein product [Allacma fusca]|uniref:C2 domain-containing protein n=1 Tax=Allacma fusca TaxID=39272 RepID=A0A8J2L4H9_9HEXA|nr:unnamed protein product [Allacma fusca]